LPRRHGNDRNGGSFSMGKRRWLARNHHLGSQGVLSIVTGKPRVRDTVDLISDTQFRTPGYYADDFARKVRTGSERKGLWQRALAGPNPPIPRADTGGCDLDQDLARAG